MFRQLEYSMKNCNQKTPLLIVLLTASLLATACANKAATRQEDIDRYAALEANLIDEEAAEKRRRQSEIRIADRLRQQDLERIKTQNEKIKASQQTYSEELKSTESDADGVSASNLVILNDTTPEVTQVVVSTGTDEALWVLQDYPSPINGMPLCAVVSKPSKITNGSLDTNVAVIVGADTIYLRTDATFDPDATETGLRVDAGLPILFDSYLNELTAVIDASYSRLRTALDTGSTLIVTFAYSPQLSTAETYVLELSLDSIAEPLAQLDNCVEPLDQTTAN